MDTTLQKITKPKIIQSFWTAPMRPEQIYYNLVQAFASAKSIKKQGYGLVMYTDCVGAKLLDGFPYDKIEIINMEDVNTAMFAAIKYFALQKEPVGVVHLDFDIIINKPCIKTEGCDIIIERKVDLILGGKYKPAHEFFRENNELEEIGPDVLLTPPFIVGTVGFNSESVREKFLKMYFKAVDLFRKKKTDAIIDLVLEQQYLPYISRNSNSSVYCVAPLAERKALFPEQCTYYSDEFSGYTHFHSRSKYSETAQREFISLLGNEDIRVINKNYMKYYYGR